MSAASRQGRGTASERRGTTSRGTKARGTQGGGSGAGRQRRGGGSALVVGGHPTVDLLPREVLTARKSRRIRRGVIAGAALVLVGVVLGGAFVKVVAVQADLALAEAQQRNAELVARQSEYADVLALQAEITEREAARRVATGTEVDWRGVIDDVSDTLPLDARVVSVSIEAGTPSTAYAAATVPLQGPRVAQMSFIVESIDMLATPEIMEELESLPGFVDMQVPSTTTNETGVETSFVVHVDQRAYANRFPLPNEAAEENTTTDGTVDADVEAGAGAGAGADADADADAEAKAEAERSEDES